MPQIELFRDKNDNSIKTLTSVGKTERTKITNYYKIDSKRLQGKSQTDRSKVSTSNRIMLGVALGNKNNTKLEDLNQKKKCLCMFELIKEKENNNKTFFSKK